MDRLSDYDYALPEELIAQEPARRREGARLLLLTPSEPRHHRVDELPELLADLLPGVLLIVNDTQVIPARLTGHKQRADGSAGGAVELLLCDPIDEGGPASPRWEETWRCLYRASKPLRALTPLVLDGAAAPAAQVLQNEGGGRVVVRFSGVEAGGFLSALQRIGQVPLPPYIRRPLRPDEADRERYQTVFARVPGAVAAPTAGLHFSDELLARLSALGARRASVTLHVGPGTFSPVKDDDLDRHVMHPERYHIPEATSLAIAEARTAGRPVLAVGTTVVRALESATPNGARVPISGPGTSALFIRPPYRFRAVDALLTNFHLPRSTLLMLVSALAGRRRLLSAYEAAVAARYRFFSYGDAMLIPGSLEDHD